MIFFKITMHLNRKHNFYVIAFFMFDIFVLKNIITI